jgi:hypothetical protein
MCVHRRLVLIRVPISIRRPIHLYWGKKPEVVGKQFVLELKKLFASNTCRNKMFRPTIRSKGDYDFNDYLLVYNMLIIHKI